MSRMSDIFQSVYEMMHNDKDIDEIAKSLGISKSLIENIDVSDDDVDEYRYLYPPKNHSEINHGKYILR